MRCDLCLDRSIIAVNPFFVPDCKNQPQCGANVSTLISDNDRCIAFTPPFPCPRVSLLRTRAPHFLFPPPPTPGGEVSQWDYTLELGPAPYYMCSNIMLIPFHYI